MRSVSQAPKGGPPSSNNGTAQLLKLLLAVALWQVCLTLRHLQLALAIHGTTLVANQLVHLAYNYHLTEEN